MSFDVLNSFQQEYQKNTVDVLSMREYLELCKVDKLTYATAAERMLHAIGEPEIIDTSKDERLGRIFSNRKIKQYPAFKDFYGIETQIEQIVNFFKHASQGLEERKQVLYLLGPVGSSKSSCAELLKKLMEKYPIYTIRAKNATTGEIETSPIYESPLGLFDVDRYGEQISEQFGIPQRYLETVPSPWAVKRLREVDGDINQIEVVRMNPSILNQVAITKTEPGDDNNQDISSLVGRVDIRKLEDYSQDDPDAYSYSGGLNVTTQGVLDCVEMFKWPLKVLHPLLTATQEGHYNGTQGFGALPHQGIILSHSNLSEWEAFKAEPKNEAFLDRVCVIKIPYCLRVTEEQQIYEKLIHTSELATAPCAPGTLRMLAQFSVLSRLTDPENSSIWAKLRAYDGEHVKSEEPTMKTIREYREDAGPDEGMDGISTRFAYKILSKVFNYDTEETAANPVHLMAILADSINSHEIPEKDRERCKNYLSSLIEPKYAQFIGDEIQKAYLESYDEYGQNLFVRYYENADAWKRNEEYRDANTGQVLNRDALNEELEKLEKPAGISNPKEFRDEVVSFILRHRAENGGEFPNWRAFNKIKTVIEKRMFSKTEDLLPIISFNKKASTEEEQKHSEFLKRMVDQGYTERQVRILVEWYVRYSKHS